MELFKQQKNYGLYSIRKIDLTQQMAAKASEIDNFSPTNLGFSITKTHEKLQMAAVAGVSNHHPITGRWLTYPSEKYESQLG